ncbi:MAG: UDP-N-acetylmuramoyl-tripeptide--D-alanyl-D-alanine ligase [Lentisphaerae bacterium ADurb.BinA184]|nr:MAG: UDP-N-acetylmuramoyl-tripeptide--D-alanyl-D-alanine ligase [Lentisphaerae bacterium ADurb.BinA184]
MFTLNELRSITGGRWLVAPALGGTELSGIQDDSRYVGPGMLFPAILGETADGHAFLGDAIAKGAAGVCVQAPLTRARLAECRGRGVAVLRVPDTLRAFHALAAAHRRRFPQTPIIALTGSSGKTSTRAMLSAILEAAFPGAVLSTAGNTNNHFGVPRNVLRLGPAHRIAVLELGTNHFGEIATLAAIVGADIGLIVNIGPAHLEAFGDCDGVAREKGVLFESLSPAGVAIMPAECEQAAILRRKAGGRRVLTFGVGAGADVRVEYLGWRGDGYRATLSWKAAGVSHDLRWAIGGAHQAMNAAAAAAAATVVGVAPEVIVAGLAGTVLPGMRMDRKTVAGVCWINDAYNANPASTRAALDWVAELLEAAPGASCLVVLGDMLELGTVARRAHADVLAHALRVLPGAVVVAVGPLMSAAAADCGVRSFPDAAAAGDFVRRHAVPGGLVLLKGSHAMRLEGLLPG